MPAPSSSTRGGRRNGAHSLSSSGPRDVIKAGTASQTLPQRRFSPTSWPAKSSEGSVSGSLVVVAPRDASTLRPCGPMISPSAVAQKVTTTLPSVAW